MASQRNKIRQAVQALRKNHSILVTSGSGMTVDSGLPYFRGSIGLWKHYPVFKSKKIIFDELVSTSFFENQPNKFWYVFGDLYNKYQEAKPHEGYNDLKEILEVTKPDGNWFVYHEGVDDLYQKANYPEEQLMQGKGNIFWWQCKNCQKLEEIKGYKFKFYRFRGESCRVPSCIECNNLVRPNINLKSDLDWIETKVQEQNDNFEKWYGPNQKRSMTVIEIGAGPVQPLARELGESFLKNDKYRCTLIRINPIKERSSQYQWESEEIFKLVNEEGFNRETKLPNFLGMDYSHITQDEERQYKALKNQLIEIEMGAKDALKLIKDELINT